jgi:hypothetical protein
MARLPGKQRKTKWQKKEREYSEAGLPPDRMSENMA